MMAGDYNPLRNQRPEIETPGVSLPTRKLAGAVSPILDGFVLPYGFYSMNWNYNLVTNEIDTLGGRVTQILSINIGTVTWESVAGSREDLLRISKKIEDTMRTQATTQRSVLLTVPSRGWVFDVFVQSMPEVAWSTNSVDYPYKLSFEIEQDYGTMQALAIQNEISRLRAGIGNSGRFRAGDVTVALAEIQGSGSSAGELTTAGVAPVPDNDPDLDQSGFEFDPNKGLLPNGI